MTDLQKRNFEHNENRVSEAKEKLDSLKSQLDSLDKSQQCTARLIASKQVEVAAAQAELRIASQRFLQAVDDIYPAQEDARYGCSTMGQIREENRGTFGQFRP